MADPTDKKSKTLALTSLLIGKSQSSAEHDQVSGTLRATGPRPTEEEIWNWMHDGVSESRAHEIRSHLATNAELYETWRQQRLAIAELEEEQKLSTQHSSNVSIANTSKSKQTIEPGETRAHIDSDEQTTDQPTNVRRIRKRNYLPAGTGIAIAASVAAFVLIKPMLTSTVQTDFWKDWNTPKSSTVREYSDEELASLRRVKGAMRAELAKGDLLTIGPDGEEMLDAGCDGVESCITNEEQLIQLGSALTTTRLHCIRETDLSVATLNTLTSSSLNAVEIAELALIHQPLSELSNQASEAAATMTSSADQTARKKPVCTTTDIVIQRLFLTK